MSSPKQVDPMFANPNFDPEKFLKEMHMVGPAREFGIVFTPRSGSSWLTDILTQTKLLGKPQEWFNPNFVPDIARAINARDIESFVKMLKRKQKLGNFFSYEITMFQMLRAFENDAEFFTYFRPSDPMFYLTREDMVLQAISLAKAIKTSVFHSAHSTHDDVQRADQEFTYDGEQIKKWLNHIFELEQKSEAFFKRNDIQPVRITYEQITRAGTNQTVRLFLDRLRPDAGDDLELPEIQSAHSKIASGRSEEFGEQFRKENARMIEKIARFRDRHSGG